MRNYLAWFLAAAFLNISYGFAADPNTITTKFINASRQEVGEAVLTETPLGVLIKIDLRRNAPGMTPGTHALHVHEVGECEPPFTSAGAHFNPLKKDHGFLHKQGQHLGDLPNIHVVKDAPLVVEFLVPQMALSDAKTGIFDADGSALVIHQGADDYQTDPAGNSGDRVACGVLEQKRGAK
jgi:superoxide dismutase, Cu-Zn family